MLATRARTRCIEAVPGLLVMMLNDLGKLPPIPNEPRPGVLGFRLPTLADMESVKWLASWSGPRTDEHGFRQVAGLASYRDYYQMHDSSDVRELCALRGSRRACVELTKWLRDDAESHDRRLVGAFETLDLGIATLMARLGGRPESRALWSYHPA